ncbi:hypothetical protein PPO43_10475 [Saprospira sp. CCB-QB6]|uniref:hypothetical protein n=1 Tax=Saprospira sp. CCB-QB6 TaxID=3023936 RepID=UPI00234AC887|nr:hypothetical protein [Saprospira sp. CCB-QB6]WCL80395.1 hypothetical protein PPO43_10475 [Saprospira sp. CCB-QB6]
MRKYSRLTDFIAVLIAKIFPFLMALAIPLSLLYWNWRWTLGYFFSSIFIFGQIGEWRRLTAYRPHPLLFATALAALVGWGFLIYYVPLSPWWTGGLIALLVLISTYGLDWVKAKPLRYFYLLQQPKVDWELWLNKDLKEEDWTEVFLFLRQKNWIEPIEELQERCLSHDEEELDDAFKKAVWKDAQQAFAQDGPAALKVLNYFRIATFFHFLLESPYLIDGLCASIHAPTETALLEAIISHCNKLLDEELEQPPCEDSLLPLYLRLPKLYNYFDSWPQLSSQTPQLNLLLEEFKAKLILLAIQYQAIDED